MKLFLLILTFLSANSIFAQTEYFQQKLSYTIDVKLNDQEKTVSGTATIQYTNASPDTLHFIWFHIWPNAYKNRNTALFKQIDADDSRKSKEADATPGWIEGLDFTVNGVKASTSTHDNPDYIDVIKLNLQQPLLPGNSITIATPFTVKLPHYFSRSGYDETEFMVTQWYPKPAVYDKDGWHEFPYLDMGEYYSEYANYHVTISLPGDYIVGATGVMQNKKELDAYKLIGAKNAKNRNGTPELYKAQSAKNKTLSYKADNVVDFAWFADKNIVIQYDTIQLKSKVVDAFTFYHNKENTIWNNSIDYVKDATRKYSEWIGEYEYPTVQAFEGPKNNASGGMEYPMITLITQPDANPENLDAVITHEVGHNWFMGMLGSNERKHTWQDEGLNTYYQFRYEADKYRSNSVAGELPPQLKKMPADKFQSAIYKFMTQIPMTTPIDIPAADFKSSEDYGLTSYIKTAMWLYKLETIVGREGVDKAFQQYFNDWNGKHPTPKDMQNSFEKALARNLDDWFALLEKPEGIKY
ncbi:MAG: M1 family metallopeptidase [Niabella sp.]